MLLVGRSKGTLSGLGVSRQIYPLGYCEQPSKPCEASSLSSVHSFLAWQSDMLLRSCAGGWCMGEIYLTFEGQKCPGLKCMRKVAFVQRHASVWGMFCMKRK